MATAKDFAQVDWTGYPLDDPAAPGTKQTGEWMLGHARLDAWNAYKQAVLNTEKLDQILALLATLVPPVE